MAASLTRRRAARTVLAGPFTSVKTTVDPFDDVASVLQDATNCYIPDPAGGGVYALPGMTLENAGQSIPTPGTSFRGQGAFSHTDASAVTTNFSIWNGRLFRVNAARTTYTDVTPTAIDAARSTRVYGTSFIGQLVITDGVHRPWVASNLSATPITATPIDFDGAGGAWAAFGPAVGYAGSLFFILKSVGGVAAQTDIAWSVPADPTVGYQQTDYDFRWTLEQSVNQNALSPLYGLAAENTQLYYWRANAIGSISGTPGPTLQGQATHDAISQNVGTLSPQSIVLFGDNVFFVDQIGRPYRLQQGTRELTPLWLALRSIVDASASASPAVTQMVCTAGFEPNLNLYIVAPWSSLPSQDGPPTEGYTFDARTGAYFGRFQIAAGVQMDTIGTFIDVFGRAVLMVQGSATAPVNAQLAASGYLWSMNSVVGVGDSVTTETGTLPALFLTTEDGQQVTTEGTTVNWNDGSGPKVVSVTTNRLGYGIDTVQITDRIAALVGSPAACTVTMRTAAVAETVEGTPVPSTVQDGIGRLVCCSSGIQGRGLVVTLQPTTTTVQWSLQQLSATMVESAAPPDEG